MKLRILAVLSVLVVASGCAVSSKKAITVAEPLDAAVEKIFEEEKQVVEIEASKLPTTLAVVPFQNLTEEQQAFDVVRRVISNHVSSKNYSLLHWQLVDDKLKLAGIDPTMAYQQDAATLADALGVDGVLFGDITDYERFHAGIIAQIKVGVALRLINRNGEVLWQEQDTATSRAGGVSLSPIGLLLNAAVATMHLKEENLFRAADDVGRELARLMPEPKRLQTDAGPVIKAVIHNAAKGALKYGDVLEVGIQGAPNMRASAVIEGVGRFDLQEVEPGEYIGKIPVSKKANANNVVVEGILMDTNGNTTRWVSPFGLLTVDNIAPTAVADFTAAANNQSLNLSWQLNDETDVDGYQVYLKDKASGQLNKAQFSRENSLTINNLNNFEQYQVQISAIDQAGNEGKPVQIAATPMPDARFADYQVLDSVLPANINGQFILAKQNSPYQLKQLSVLTAASSLLVEPGVVIKVATKAGLIVNGELNIYGNASNPVNVSASSGSFSQFATLASEQTVTIDYLVVDGADVALNIKQGKASISNSQFVNNQYSALDISGSAQPNLSGNLFQGSNTAGVLISEQAQPVFVDCQFKDNQPFHIQSSSIYQIQATGNSWTPAAGSSTVLGDVKY